MLTPDPVQGWRFHETGRSLAYVPWSQPLGRLAYRQPGKKPLIYIYIYIYIYIHTYMLYVCIHTTINVHVYETCSLIPAAWKTGLSPTRLDTTRIYIHLLYIYTHNTSIIYIHTQYIYYIYTHTIHLLYIHTHNTSIIYTHTHYNQCTCVWNHKNIYVCIYIYIHLTRHMCKLTPNLIISFTLPHKSYMPTRTETDHMYIYIYIYICVIQVPSLTQRPRNGL